MSGLIGNAHAYTDKVLLSYNSSETCAEKKTIYGEMLLNQISMKFLLKPVNT